MNIDIAVVWEAYIYLVVIVEELAPPIPTHLVCSKVGLTASKLPRSGTTTASPHSLSCGLGVETMEVSKANCEKLDGPGHQ